MSPSDPTEVHIVFENNQLLPQLYGESDSHLKLLENSLDISIYGRGNEIVISGTPVSVAAAQTVINDLYRRLETGMLVDESEVDAAVKMALHPSQKAEKPGKKQATTKIETRRKVITPRTPGQAQYIDLLHDKNFLEQIETVSYLLNQYF